MLADNIQFLRKDFPGLFNTIKDQVIKDDIIVTKIEITKNNKKTVFVEKAEKKTYLHSRYNPQREAESVVNKFTEKEKIDENVHVVFFGVGLGYHIEAFTEQFPNTEFSIYEPSFQVFNLFLDEKNLKSPTMRNMILLHCALENLAVENFFKELFIKAADKNIVILNLPIYERVFQEEYQDFLVEFKKYIRLKRMNLHTEFSFQKNWTMNSVTNLKILLETPNILMQHADVFKGKPVVVVSAGPSLDYEIENLKKIKDEGLAFLLSVGSAINTLLDYDIFPDAICGFDPSNVITVYEKLIESKITEIPLIFGSRIGPVVLDEYKGPKLHMLVNVDKINRFFLKDAEGKEMKVVIEAPSIAVVVLHLAHILGFSKIILTGQNLAFLNNKNYAKGINYQTIIDPLTAENIDTTLDVNGEEILTSSGYNIMRRDMETFIEEFDLDVINTTIGGAAIKGTDFMLMDTVLQQVLTEKVVQGDEFDRISKSSIYDREYLIEKIGMMEKAFKQYQEIVREIKRLIRSIQPLIKNKNKIQMETMYNKLDQAMMDIEENSFFRLIAMPTNVIYYQYLTDQTERIRTEKNSFEKVKQYIEQLGKFMSHLNKDADNLSELMKDISDYKEC